MDREKDFLVKSRPMQEDRVSYCIMLETCFLKSPNTSSDSDNTCLHSDHMVSHTF